VYSHNWTEIALVVLIWVVVAREAWARVDLHLANVLPVVGSFTFTAHPDCVPFFLGGFVDVVFERIRHVGWQ